MNYLITLVLSIFLAILSGCAGDPTSPKGAEPATARVTVKLGGVGALAKKADIEFAGLVLVLSASGEASIRDTFPLSGSGSSTITRVYDGLAAGKGWTLTAMSFDSRDSLVHSGASSFTPSAGRTIDVEMSLNSRFAMFKAALFPIPGDVNRCELVIDGVVRGDTVLPESSVRPDTAMLDYDYLLAGRSHSIRLNAYGDSAGESKLLYRADSLINIPSGTNGYFRLVLKRVGDPAPTTGGITAQILLGRVWTVFVDGVFEDQNGGIPSGPMRNVMGILPGRYAAWSADTVYRIVGNTLLDSGCTLSVAPGTRVEFMNAAYLEIRGQIVAVGTSADSVYFIDGEVRLNTRGGTTYDSLGNYLEGPRFEYCDFRSSNIRIMNVVFSGRGPYLRNSRLSTLYSDGFGHADGMYVADSRIEVLGSSQLELVRSKVTNSYIGSFRINGYAGPVSINNNKIDALFIDRWSPGNSIEMNIIGTIEWTRPSTTNSAFLHDNDILGVGGGTYLRVASGSDGTAPLNAANNYWGDLTSEMGSKGGNADISGLHDFHDNFSLVRIDYSGWAEQPIQGAGPDW